jgi:putative transposase
MKKESFSYKHYNHSIGLACVHLVWIPKRRKAVLKGDIAKRCREIFYGLAIEKEWEIKALEIAPDHVHLFVCHQPDLAISQVVQAFKGRSSHHLRKEFPELLKLPSLWTRSYFHTTAGKVSAQIIQEYINDPHHWEKS